jgi:hypothetical protein
MHAVMVTVCTLIRVRIPSSKEKLVNIGVILDQDKNIDPILNQYIDQYWYNIVATRDTR